MNAAILSGCRGAMQSTSSGLADGFVAAWRSWAASGMSSGRFAFAAVVKVFSSIGGMWYDRNTKSINRRSVLDDPLCFIYIRIWLGTISFEQKGKGVWVWAVEP
jgi:hypothetical protein